MIKKAALDTQLTLGCVCYKDLPSCQLLLDM